MVEKLTNVTSLTGNGMRDWLIQRSTSVLMAGYIIFLLAFVVSHRPIDYAVWQLLFRHLAMRLFSSLFLLSLFWHAWIGMWTIITDYIKSAGLRLILQLFIITVLLLYFIWGLAIFWGS
jgi:succinate dehydrogenase / fumarate reductase membrane anchor subunit